MFRQQQNGYRRIGIVTGAGVTLIAWGLARSFVLSAPDVPTLDVGKDFPIRDVSKEAQYVVCPWRQPDADIARFFPRVAKSAVVYEETLVFTRQRPLLGHLLGRAPTGAENALQIHRIMYRPARDSKAAVGADNAPNGSEQTKTKTPDAARNAAPYATTAELPAGAIVTRYIRGASGVIELMLAVDTRERVIGARLQRLREPDAVARELQSARFLGTFQGRTYASSWARGPSIVSDADLSVSKVAGAADARTVAASDAARVSEDALLEGAHVALVLLHVGEQTLARR